MATEIVWHESLPGRQKITWHNLERTGPGPVLADDAGPANKASFPDLSASWTVPLVNDMECSVTRSNFPILRRTIFVIDSRVNCSQTYIRTN